MSSRSSSIRISYMNPTEIYSVNSYLSFYLTESQSCCFPWTSWLPGLLLGNAREGLSLPQSLAAQTTGLGPPPRGARQPHSWPWGALTFHLTPFQVALQDEHRKALESEPWVLILALPPKHTVTWASPIAPVQWTHAGTNLMCHQNVLSHRWPHHVICFTLCHLRQELIMRKTNSKFIMRKTDSES